MGEAARRRQSRSPAPTPEPKPPAPNTDDPPESERVPIPPGVLRDCLRTLQTMLLCRLSEQQGGGPDLGAMVTLRAQLNGMLGGAAHALNLADDAGAYRFDLVGGWMARPANGSADKAPAGEDN